MTLQQCDGGEKLPDHDKPCPVCGATSDMRCQKSSRGAITPPIASSNTTNWEVAKNYRNSIIEECALEIERWEKDVSFSYQDLIDRIRALKDSK